MMAFPRQYAASDVRDRERMTWTSLRALERAAGAAFRSFIRGCQTVAVEVNRSRPSSTRRRSKFLILQAFLTVVGRWQPCLNRFDSRWRYQKRPILRAFLLPAA
jgi:hypothetical protein